MKVKILTFNQQDSQGHVFSPCSVDVKSTPMMTRNFNLLEPLGRVQLSKDNNSLYAHIDRQDLKGLYPSIGFQIIKSVKRPDGVTEISEIKLHQIGICDKPNIDSTILPI